MLFKNIVEAGKALAQVGVTLENASKAWNDASTEEIIEALANPNVTTHKVGDYDVCLLKMGNVGLVVMNHYVVGMGNYGLVVKFSETLFSREIRVACVCCSPQSYHSQRGHEHALESPTQFFSAIEETKKLAGVEMVVIQSGSHWLPEWMTDLTKVKSVPVLKEIPLDFVSKDQQGTPSEKLAYRHISEPK